MILVSARRSQQTWFRYARSGGDGAPAAGSRSTQEEHEEAGDQQNGRRRRRDEVEAVGPDDPWRRKQKTLAALRAVAGGAGIQPRAGSGRALGGDQILIDEGCDRGRVRVAAQIDAEDVRVAATVGAAHVGPEERRV